MENHCILISGPAITKDNRLVSELQKSGAVVKNSTNSQIDAIISKQNVDLILFEFSKKSAAELKMIKAVKSRFPDLAIILIDGERELMAEAFSYGVKDAFKKPYKSSLIVERVKALLGE